MFSRMNNMSPLPKRICGSKSNCDNISVLLHLLNKEADNYYVYTIQINILGNHKLIRLIVILFLASAKTHFIACLSYFNHSLGIHIRNIQFIVSTYLTSKFQAICLSDINLKIYIYIEKFLKKIIKRNVKFIIII